MDQKPSKDLAPRELLGNVYTAQNEMETWLLPEDQAMLTTEKKKKGGGGSYSLLLLWPERSK